MIDIKAIKAAAIDSDETGFASVLTNNDTVIALCDEIEGLKDCLKKANDQAEHFEREWYLRGDEVERLRTKLEVTDKTKFDGIDCRDETIKLQDDAIGQLQEQNRWLDEKLAEVEKTVRFKIEQAYERGWVEAASWANDHHLISDIGSPAYINDREPHLDNVAEMEFKP